MSIRQPANIPAALSTARHQFDRWRSRQPTKRTRLPEDLWQKAVGLARKHGLNKTARALGLKYESLKEHLVATTADESKPSQGRYEFLELLPRPMTSSSIECTIELDDQGSTTMRMHVRGACMADLASFVRGFRGSRG